MYFVFRVWCNKFIDFKISCILRIFEALWTWIFILEILSVEIIFRYWMTKGLWFIKFCKAYFMCVKLFYFETLIEAKLLFDAWRPVQRKNAIFKKFLFRKKIFLLIKPNDFFSKSNHHENNSANIAFAQNREIMQSWVTLFFATSGVGILGIFVELRFLRFNILNYLQIIYKYIDR